MSVTASLVVFAMGVAVAGLIYARPPAAVPREVSAAAGSVVNMLAFYPFLRATESVHLPFAAWAVWCVFSAAAAAGLVRLFSRGGRS